MAEKEQQFIRTLDAILKQRLEDKILELIDLPKGKLDKNILDYERIARERGFPDILYFIDQTLADIGRAQVRAARRKLSRPKKRSRDEAVLEDYLMKGSNITRIEEGLVAEERQSGIKSGILDIRAKGAGGERVNLELKMREYDDRDVALQLLKYLNERPQDRFVFVAPTVTAPLFFTLKAPYVDSGQLTFHQVIKNGNNYSFMQLSEADFPEPDKINWAKNNSKNHPEQGDIITVVDTPRKPRATRPRSAAKPETSPAKKEANTAKPDGIVAELKSKEQVIKPEKKDLTAEESVRSIMSAFRRQPGKYEISSKQMRKLKELASHAGLRLALEEYKPQQDVPDERLEALISKEDLFAPDFLPDREIDLFDKGVMASRQVIKCCSDLVPTAYATLSKFAKTLSTGEPSDEFYNNIMQSLAEIRDGLSTAIIGAQHNKTLKDYHTLLRRLEKQLKGEKQEYIRALAFAHSFHAGLITAELIDAKLKRTEILREVNKKLAFEYLAYCPALDCSDGPIVSRICDCVREDNEVYTALISNFRTLTTEKEDVRGLPLYCKVLQLTHPDAKDTQGHPGLIEVSSDIKKYLDSLKVNPVLTQFLDPEVGFAQVKEYFANLGKEDARHQAEILINLVLQDPNAMIPVSLKDHPAFRQARSLKRHRECTPLYRAFDIGTFLQRIMTTFDQRNKKFEQIFADAVKFLSGFSQRTAYSDEELTVLRDDAKNLVAEANSINSNPHLQKALNQLTKISKNPSAKKQIDDAVQALVFYNLINIREELLVDLLFYKTERARVLNHINPAIAASYLAFTPCLDAKLTGEPENTLQTVQDTAHFAQRDTDLYASILKNIRVAEMPAAAEAEKIEQQEQQYVPKEAPAETPIEIKETPNKRLAQSLIQNSDKYLTEDNEAAIQYFAQDITDMDLPEEQISLLETALSRLRLDRKLKREDRRPSEIKLRNFLDDIRLSVYRGQTPDETSVKSIYKNA